MSNWCLFHLEIVRGKLFLHPFHPEMHPKQQVWHHCDVTPTPKMYEWHRLEVEQVTRMLNLHRFKMEMC